MSKPTTAVQFCNFLVLTNEDPELRDEGLPAFDHVTKKTVALTPDTFLVAFQDQSFVLDDKGDLHDCDDQEELCALLLSWAQENGANTAALVDFCFSALRNQPPTPQASHSEPSA